jgi:hypothetical protein
MTKFLSKQDIFSRSDLKPKSVLVPAWGGAVRFKPMTLSERREIRKQSSVFEIDPQTGDKARVLDVELFEANALIYCCLDPQHDGTMLFEPGDQDHLMTKISSGPISIVSNAIMRESGMAPDAVKSGKGGTEG